MSDKNIREPLLASQQLGEEQSHSEDFCDSSHGGHGQGSSQDSRSGLAKSQFLGESLVKKSTQWGEASFGVGSLRDSRRFTTKDMKVFAKPIKDKKGLLEFNMHYQHIFNSLTDNKRVETKVERVQKYDDRPHKKQEESRFVPEVKEEQLSIINIAITNDNKYCVCLATSDEQKACTVMMYKLEDFDDAEKQKEIYFSRRIAGQHVVMMDIEQNSSGKQLAIPYQNDGWLKVILLNTGCLPARADEFASVLGLASNPQEKLNEIDICALFEISNFSKPIMGFYNPMVTCTYINDDLLYIQCYMRSRAFHFMAVWSIKEKQVKDTNVKVFQNGSHLDFPIKSFYSYYDNKVHTFYRQGRCVSYDCMKILLSYSSKDQETQKIEQNLDVQHITEQDNFLDLGQMVLMFGRVLIVRSSNSILFYQMMGEEDHDSGHACGKWHRYLKMNDRKGALSVQPRTNKFQITTESEVYFYYMSPDDFQPVLENVIYNFMNCSQLIMGNKDLFLIAFKTSQPNFDIYTRSFEHEFKIRMHKENYEGSQGQVLYQRKNNEEKAKDKWKMIRALTLKDNQDHLCNKLPPAKYYVLVHDKEVQIKKINDFKDDSVPFGEVKPTNDGTEILYVQSSFDHKKIALLVGHRVIRDEVYITEILIYKLKHKDEYSDDMSNSFRTDPKSKNQSQSDDAFERDIIEDYEDGYCLVYQQPYNFDGDTTCSQFHFDVTDDNFLIFFTQNKIIRFGYESSKDDDSSGQSSHYGEEQDSQIDTDTVYDFHVPLTDPPNFGVFNSSQTKCIVSSNHDVILVDLVRKIEIDIDQTQNIEDVCNVVADDEYFYVLANKKNGIMGYYLFMIEIKNCHDRDLEYVYLINWANKTTIRQVDLNFLEDINYDANLKEEQFTDPQDLADLDDCPHKEGRQKFAQFLGEDKRQKTNSFMDEFLPSSPKSSDDDQDFRGSLPLRQYLVVSYKAEGSNTYNVFVFDVKSKLIKFWYETYHLYELPVRGFLLPNTKDFYILSKQGIHVINLGSQQLEDSKNSSSNSISQLKKQIQNVPGEGHGVHRKIENYKGRPCILHSLGACNYLKLEAQNHVHFKHQFNNNRRICIQNQYTDQQGMTNYDDIYKIKIDTPDLCEILLMRSLYKCSTNLEVSQLIKLQPNQKIFFKVFLELDTKNLISYLTFDRASIGYLLEQTSENLSERREYPVFFKNRENSSGIDVALKRNQISSLQIMIDYICKYQNEHVYAHLFNQNLVELLKKGVNLQNLFQSRILNMPLTYFEWPSQHHEIPQSTYNKSYKPYNNPLYQIRYEYKKVFPELAKEENDESDDSSTEEFDYQFGAQKHKCKKQTDEVAKMHQIEYFVNMLPMMDKRADNQILIDAIAESQEIAIFRTATIQDFINYRWESFAYQQFRTQLIFHTIYLITLTLYIRQMYFAAQDSKSPSYVLLTICGLALILPLQTEIMQIQKLSFSHYIQSGENDLDLFYICLGYSQIGMQIYLGPGAIECKITLILLLLAILFKFVYLMRVFRPFSKLKTMVIQCIYQLKSFFVFFLMMLIFFALMLSTLGPNPQTEYRYLDAFFANIIFVLRISIADLANFQLLDNLTINEQRVFWVVWMMVFFLGCIVFLNFIIAEISDAYNQVISQLDEKFYLERALMVKEAEDTMTISDLEDKIKFPNFIVIRQRMTDKGDEDE